MISQILTSLMLTKICTLCNEEKPLEAFHKDKRNKSGRTARCSSCRTAIQIAFQNKQKSEKPEHYKRWRKSNNYFSKYGLTLEQVETKLYQQSYICAVCNDTLTEYAVDHCHSTGRVRDLLCSSCNKGLGFFRDDPVRLMSAIKYLERHNDSGID